MDSSAQVRDIGAGIAGCGTYQLARTGITDVLVAEVPTPTTGC